VVELATHAQDLCMKQIGWPERPCSAGVGRCFASCDARMGCVEAGGSQRTKKKKTFSFFASETAAHFNTKAVDHSSHDRSDLS